MEIKRELSARPAGLSLLEVMIAITVLSIAIMGTSNAWLNAQRLSVLQREEAIVQSAINRYINDMRALPFTQVDNISSEADPNIASNPLPGFSGGDYAAGSNRKKPGKFKLYLGGSPGGLQTDGALRGLIVSTTPFTDSVAFGDRFVALGTNVPEMRIIFINNEIPTESQMGEEPGALLDGIDLDADGRISNVPLTVVSPPVNGSYGATVEFGDADSRAAFPRLLAVPITNPQRSPINAYVNVSQMIIYPVVVQVRWWSAAGFPREINVITFLTNRSGSSTPAVTP